MKVKIKTPDGFILDGVFEKPQKSTRGIIFCHGMTMDKDREKIFVRVEPQLSKKGFSTLRFDFRGHGQSSGDPTGDFTISGEITDLASAVEFLKDQGIALEGIVGISFGASIASLYVGDHPVNRLFLINPALVINVPFPGYGWWMKNGAEKAHALRRLGVERVAARLLKVGKPLADDIERYFPMRQLKKYKGKLVIVQGNKDRMIPWRANKTFFDTLDNKEAKYILLEGAGHGFHQEPYETEVVDLIIGFFGRQ